MSSGGPKRSRLQVSVVDARGRALPAPGLAAWLKRVAPARVAGEVTIAVVPDTRSRTLNHTYRGKDAATDVLSFPGGPAARNPKPVAFLGDIVIARGVARRQAREAGLDAPRLTALCNILAALDSRSQRVK